VLKTHVYGTNQQIFANESAKSCRKIAPSAVLMHHEVERIVHPVERHMEFAESVPPAPELAREPRLPRTLSLRDATLVLQADGAVTGVHGLAWLAEQRDEATVSRLAALRTEAREAGWTHDDLLRAQLACLRPRRSEINALGRAYLEALAPGAVDAAHRLRRAGLSVELSGEVAVDALFGVAHALGVPPTDIRAPRLRFDALGACTACEVTPRPPRASRSPVVVVGTRPLAGDHFVRFTGFVAHEGAGDGLSVESFGELAELLG
jgi:hypothetical protein